MNEMRMNEDYLGEDSHNIPLDEEINVDIKTIRLGFYLGIA